MDPTRSAIGTWSGGRFMHFGEPLEEERLRALLRPGGGIDTVITADAYGAGAADSLLGEALEGVERERCCLVGAVGHDFYAGAREGAKGFPRFTDPRLRGPGEYAAYLRMATERSLERLGVDRFDVLMLHNPDRTGYSSAAVWEGMEALRSAGLTRLLGVAPGPANGFTLDTIDCMERFGESIDWAMLILGPLEPWPGELVLDAAQAHEVKVITRVVDYGGMFHDDVLPGHEFAPYDHRKFRPDGWVAAGREKLERMRPYAQRRHSAPHGVAGVAGAVRVVQHQHVEAVDPAALEAALGRHAQVVTVGRRVAQPPVGEARKAFGPVALAEVEVVPHGAHDAHVLAGPAGDRAPEHPVGLAGAVHVGGHHGSDRLIGPNHGDETLVVERLTEAHVASAAPGADGSRPGLERG